ncbi:NBS-LRR type resistance protein [Cucumis melo var. makuwa]|uniref:NBS-LRR type resistance protein n=1 Tax=Cucumis melo var. makuwa TaxID=1194695 RepID=A0A5A7TK50_CUCMM|nr:NBS-LRR type resistance protein [Cucumis melo var. makuwa]TYK27039.1 NBS-LRR type resistance protein [Cucumis melo var. makuwa]
MSSSSVERTHQSRDPEGCTYQSSDPERYTYQSSDPEGYTYQSSDPEGCTYHLDPRSSSKKSLTSDLVSTRQQIHGDDGRGDLSGYLRRCKRYNGRHCTIEAETIDGWPCAWKQKGRSETAVAGCLLVGEVRLTAYEAETETMTGDNPRDGDGDEVRDGDRRGMSAEEKWMERRASASTS